MNFLEKENKKIFFLGNEAIVRGALEADVDFVSAYPGTPSSEVGNIFYRIQKEVKKINPNFHFEFSTNEKVAMEAAAGAAFSGLRSLVVMKNFGLNVAADFLMTLLSTGVKGGMVIFVADDPSCWSSAQVEQTTRLYSQMAHVPMLEPSTPQECKDFTKLAFELSERFKIPVMLRTSTRVSHQSEIVVVGKIEKREKKPNFEKDPNLFSTMSPRVLEMKKELLKKIEKIREASEKLKINKIENPAEIEKSKLGVLTSGVSYSYVKEALNELGLKLPVLKIGLVYPLPEKKVKNFIKNLKKILIVEELEPYLEREVKILAKEVNPKLEILGKEGEPIEGGRIWRERKAILPQVGELKPEYVILAITKLTNKKPKFDFQKHLKEFEKIKVPARPPILCSGCPYWPVVNAIKKVVDLKEVIFGGEIGCYMVFRHPIIQLQDYLYCMGSSVGVGHGIAKSLSSQKNKKLICFVGDSSFFHAAIPALINTVFNKSNPLIIVLDNQTTAMTGHQPHPGIGRKLEENGVEPIKVEEIARACGVKNLKVVDQVAQPKEFEEALKDFLKKEEVSVIIARSPCVFLTKKS